MHNVLRGELARFFKGRVESRNAFGVADVETADKVFEVKPCDEWMHGAGQVKAYFSATRKQPVLALFCGCGGSHCKHATPAAVLHCSREGVRVMRVPEHRLK